MKPGYKQTSDNDVPTWYYQDKVFLNILNHNKSYGGILTNQLGEKGSLEVMFFTIVAHEKWQSWSP